MKRLLIGILLTALMAGCYGIALAESDPNDISGSKDHPLLSRMPGFHIVRYDNIEFDSVEMRTGDDKAIKVEGEYTRIEYYKNEGASQKSAVQVFRNFANAIQKIGGKVIYQKENIETLMVAQNGAEYWIGIETLGNVDAYTLSVVKKEAMEQDVTVDASSMAGSIKDTGKVALYGIYFDTGKSDIKPESDASIQEIAKMLQADANLKLFVVGHTDNVGTFDSNIKLSNSRADAVVKALVSKYSIAATRLQAFGAGPTAPVASNQTEEGKAKNRRVELVAQ